MKKLLLITLVLLTTATFAQQDPQFTQNMFNKLAVNPGYAGTSNAFCATLISRQQWMGFDGRPQTNLLSLDYKIRPFDRFNSGIGLTVYQDQLGFEKTIQAKLAYSVHKNIGDGLLSVGIDAGVYNKSIDGNWIAVDGNGLPSNGSLDPSIPNNQTSKTAFDLGFGAYYVTPSYYIGLSSSHLTNPTLNAKADNSSYNYTLARHYYLMGGYNIQLSSPFELKPSLFVKSDVVSTQVDVNLNVEWNQLVWAGATYRLEDAVAILAGINVPEFAGISGIKVGVSYDFNTSLLNDYNSGSLEVMLKYCKPIKITPKIQRYGSVRFL